VPIQAIASAVPARVEDARAIAEATGSDVDFIMNKVGIRQRHVLGSDESGVDLAEAACRRLFETNGIKPGGIELLVFVTQTPDYPIPHNSALLAARLGMDIHLAAFDINLGCSGYVYALSLVEHMLAGEGFETGLLVTCDPYSKIVAKDDKATNAVFGDAATATLIQRSGGIATVGRCDYGTDGRGHDALIREVGGARHPLLAEAGAAAPIYDREAVRLKMKGREVFNFVLGRIPESVNRCLARNDLSLVQIDRFAFHQGSRQMVQQLAARIGAPAEKLLFNIDRYGNTVSSTIPLLLEDEIARRPAPGCRILVSGFGVGLSWATNVVTLGSHG
jgi:3-oxoacyl-[acyl-carrier-protein] synthase-3